MFHLSTMFSAKPMRIMVVNNFSLMTCASLRFLSFLEPLPFLDEPPNPLSGSVG